MVSSQDEAVLQLMEQQHIYTGFISVLLGLKASVGWGASRTQAVGTQDFLSSTSRREANICKQNPTFIDKSILAQSKSKSSFAGGRIGGIYVSAASLER